MDVKNVLVLIGSLRAGSKNRELAQAAIEFAPEGLSLTVYDGIRDLPHFDEDADGAAILPQSVHSYRRAIEAADAVLVVTPEHNGTAPAALKNAIDWSSRPYRASPIQDKPVAVIGTSFSLHGGSLGQDDVRKAFSVAHARVLDMPRIAIPRSLIRFKTAHPRDDDAVASQLRTFLEELQDALQRQQAGAA